MTQSTTSTDQKPAEGQDPRPSGPIGIRGPSAPSSAPGGNGNGNGTNGTNGAGRHEVASVAPDAGPTPPAPSGRVGGAEVPAPWVADALAEEPAAPDTSIGESPVPTTGTVAPVEALGEDADPVVLLSGEIDLPAEPTATESFDVDEITREARAVVEERLQLEAELDRLRRVLEQTEDALAGRERLLVERESAISERDRRIAALEGELAGTLGENRELRQKVAHVASETDERLRRLASGLESLELMAQERRRQIETIREEIQPSAGSGDGGPRAMSGTSALPSAARSSTVTSVPVSAVTSASTSGLVAAARIQPMSDDEKRRNIAASGQPSRDELRARAAARLETQRLNAVGPADEPSASAAASGASAGGAASPGPASGAGDSRRSILVRDQRPSPLVRAASRASQRIGTADEVLAEGGDALTASGVRRREAGDPTELRRSRRLRTEQLDAEWRLAERRRRFGRVALAGIVFAVVVGIPVLAYAGYRYVESQVFSGGGDRRVVRDAGEIAGDPPDAAPTREPRRTTEPRRAPRRPPARPAKVPTPGGEETAPAEAATDGGDESEPAKAPGEMRKAIEQALVKVETGRTEAQRRQGMRELVAKVKTEDLDALREVLASESNDKIRRAVIKALAKIGGNEPTALDVVTDAIRYDRAMEVRLEAVHAVRNLRHADAVPVLEDVIANDRDGAIRIAALGAMKAMKQQDYARSVIIGYGNEESVAGRMALVKALSDIGGSAEVGFLEQVKESAQEPPLRAAASAALSRIRRRVERGEAASPPDEGETDGEATSDGDGDAPKRQVEEAGAPAGG